MFWREARKRALELYVKYDKCASDVIRELGYPSAVTLRKWYKKYHTEIEVEPPPWPKPKKHRYTLEEKMVVLQHYLEHGCNQNRTVKALGYPSRNSLNIWRRELLQEARKLRVSGVEWKTGGEELEPPPSLRKEATPPMERNDNEDLIKQRDKLKSEVDTLQREIRKLSMEKDVLKGAIEIVKKDPGADPKTFSNKEKTLLIGALRTEYSLSELLSLLEIAESSYFYQRKRLSMADKHEAVKRRIAELFFENQRRYGYRRIHALLKREEIRISEKVVRRIMAESSLVAVGKRKKRYSAYRGEDYPAAENIIARDFHAEEPNVKWLTDITEFAIPAGRVYLSPIVDCFDGLVPSWTIGTSPDAELVNQMLDRGIKTLRPEEHPLVHSDRGFHYRWKGWLSRMETAELTRSMSKKACSPDNAACEGFFGRLKNEMFYDRSWEGVSLDGFMDTLDEYLVWYNEKRIKLSLGAMSPLEYRRSLGFSV